LEHVARVSTVGVEVGRGLGGTVENREVEKKKRDINK
jgi:hypothetical protein